ncbi:MAG: acetyl-CoA carboxylase biotin carboxyl carrier protein [Verrucomicrobiales bacterium]
MRKRIAKGLSFFEDQLSNTQGGTILEIKDIKTIVELMKRHDLTHFELEREGVKLVLKKNLDPDSIAALLSHLRGSAPANASQMPAATSAAQTAAAARSSETELAGNSAAASPPNDVLSIKSPMVGTFYRSPGPGQEPFLKVGDYVEAESTVCIIEAMKVMNEIKAECAGRVTRLVVEDATPVAYGQVLFELKP